MTSPLRRKHPITAPNFPATRRIDAPRYIGRIALAWVIGVVITFGTLGMATAAGNEPQLLPPSNNAQPTWKSRDESGAAGGASQGGAVSRPATWESGSDDQSSGGLKWKPRWPSTTSRRLTDSTKSVSDANTRQAAAAEPVDRPFASNVRQAAQLQELNPLSDPFGDRTSQPAPLELDPPTPSTGDDDRPAGPMFPTPSTDDPAPSPMPMPMQPMPGLQPRPMAPMRQADGPAPLPQPFEQAYCQSTTTCSVPMKTLRQLGNEFLDITPDLEPNVADAGATRRMDYMSASQPRAWIDRENQQVAEGRMIDFEQGRIIIEPSDGGAPVRVPFEDLSTDDLCYVTAWWRLPQECTLGDEQFAGRTWAPMTWTWKASALCHKPLYFEEESLERYGHMTGPLTQPALSGAHFFLNIAVLPYKMGINPPNECQYALGYYRPGSCAPWIIDPIPLSLRGALYQTTAVAAGITGIP